MPNEAPTHSEALHWCSDAEGGVWYPRLTAAERDVPREQLYAVTFDLLRLELIEIVTWTAGKGQGFRLSEKGQGKLGKAITPTVESKVVSPQSSVIASGRETPIDRGIRVRKAFSMSEPSALTSLLVFAFAVVFVVGLFIARQADAGFDYLAKGHTPTLTTIGAVSGQYLADGQWWRLIASGFVHIGIIHLLLNLYALLSLGRIADALWGRWRFLLIFMFSVVGGSLVTMAWRPNVLLAGASGGIWGVMMSLVAGLVIFREHLPIEFLRAESRNFFLAFGLNLMVSFVPGIAWDAHLAGGAVGFVVAILLDRIRAGAGNEGWIALVVIVLLAAIAVTGFRWQMRNSETWKPIRTWQEMMTAVRSAPPATETTPKTQTQVNLRVDPEVVFKIVAKLQNDGLMAAVAGSRNRMSRVVKAAADAHLESKQLAGLIRQNVKQPDLVHFFDTVVVVIQQIDDLAKANAGPKEWQALDEPIAELKGKMESLRMAAPALPP